MNEVHSLVSYDVSSLFTNVPFENPYTYADKAFLNDWFNDRYHLNLSKQHLVDLPRGATKEQLFLFNGQLYEQTVKTKLYVKPTNTGLLLHYKSYVDDRYKGGLVKTMLDRAFRLSSSWPYFSKEIDCLKSMFSRLKYPDK